MHPLWRTSHHFERLNPRVSTCPFSFIQPTAGAPPAWPTSQHSPLVAHLTTQKSSANSFLVRITAVREQRRQLFVSGVQHPREKTDRLPTSAPYTSTRRLSNSTDTPLPRIHELLRIEGAPRRNSLSVLTVPGIARIKFLTEDLNGTTLRHRHIFCSPDAWGKRRRTVVHVIHCEGLQH